MNLKTALIFFAGFLIAATLSAFTKAIDIYSAIGFAVVIAGVVLFIGFMLTAAAFGAYIFWLAAIDGLDAAVAALKSVGMVKDPAK